MKRGFSRTEKVAVVMTAPGSPGTEKIFISSLQQCCAKGTVLPVCRLTAEPGECLLVKPPCFTRQTSPLLASGAAMQLQSGKNGSLLPPSFPFNVPCTFCFSPCFYKDSTQPSCTAFLHKNATLKAAGACQKPSQTPARSAVQPHRCLPASPASSVRGAACLCALLLTCSSGAEAEDSCGRICSLGHTLCRAGMFPAQLWPLQANISLFTQS